jgi:hypothetical protein
MLSKGTLLLFKTLRGKRNQKNKNQVKEQSHSPTRTIKQQIPGFNSRLKKVRK